MTYNLIYLNIEYQDKSHREWLETFKLNANINYTFNIIDENSLDDKSNKYFIILPSYSHWSNNLDNKILPKIIIHKIQLGFDIKIILYTEYEAEFENCFDLINKWTSEINIPNKIVYSASGNFGLNNLNTRGINVIKNFNPIIRNAARSMISFLPIHDKIWKNNKEYLFQCYNNIPKSHRLVLLSLLKKENILNNVDWSLMRPYDMYHLLNKGINSLHTVIEKDIVLNITNEYEYILNKGKTKYSKYEDESMRISHADGEPDISISFTKNPYKNSYINIINESQFELKNTIHITEKSLIPFYFNQIPIIVATQGHVQKLKYLYGFDIFDDIVNHDYDSIENSQERMFAIVNEIKRLNSIRDEIEFFYKNNKDRFFKNREIINQLSKINPYEPILKCIIE